MSSGSSWQGVIESNRSTSTRPSPTSFVVYSTWCGRSPQSRCLATRWRDEIALECLCTQAKMLICSNGQVKIWNYETQTDLKTFEVTDVPVRCVRYIARKNWVCII
jgi:hypothetical protein